MADKRRTGGGTIAAIGRASFRHRWWVVAAWLVIAVGGFMVTGRVFDGLSGDSGANSLESIQGYNVLSDRSQVGDDVLGEVTGIDPTSAAVKAAVGDAAAQIKTISGVRTVATPYDGGPLAPGLVAKNGHGLLIDVTLNRLDDTPEQTATAAITTKLDALETALRQGGVAGAHVAVGGGAVLGQQVNDMVQADLGKAEGLSLPISLVVLVFIFGGLIAAGLPVIAAIISVFTAMAALFGFEHITKLDQNATIVVTLLGLGLSIDYGLLLVARYREELIRGDGPEAALTRAWSTAGRTIVFSALTVAGSLCGLAVFGVTSMTALAVSGVSIAAVAMTVSMTATAGLLGFARKRIRPSKRALARAAKAAADGAVAGSIAGTSAEVGFFARLARIVQRRPAVTVLLTAGLLIGAGLPLFATKPRIDSLDSLPKSLPAVQVADDLASQYGRTESPAVSVVAEIDPAALTAWAQHLGTASGITRVDPAIEVAPGLSMIDVYTSGDPESDTARALVHQIRADRPTGGRSWVVGNAALLDDIMGLITDRLPLAIAVTFAAMLILLFLMTGSLVVPLKAIAMNAISLGATVGVMNLVFQHGIGSGLLHTLTTGGLDPFVIVGVLAFAFGLSMDYEVFLLSRIKEYVDRGEPTDVAVRHGLQRSGRVITSAALLMVLVFGCFLVGRTGNTQQIGLGLAAAIAIDATLVRCVLVPATMTLLGRWNWWAPKPLARWHARFAPAPETSLSEAALPQTAPAPLARVGSSG